jgi:hypothetical protein
MAAIGWIETPTKRWWKGKRWPDPRESPTKREVKGRRLDSPFSP